MSDEHDVQERVRRLLGAAAAPPGGDRIPDEVAARLDDALAGLVAERTGAVEPDTVEEPDTGRPSGSGSAQGAVAGPRTGTGAVTDLATRRRRRWPQLLVAATAVSVVGLGAGYYVQNTNGQAASRADQASAGMAEEREAAGVAPQMVPDTDDSAERPGGSSALGAGERPRLRTSTLALDVQRIEDFGLASPVDPRSAEWQRACVRPATGGEDDWLPVRLDGDPAVLVLRPPAGGRRTGDVFACGDAGSPVASVTVQAR